MFHTSQFWIIAALVCLLIVSFILFFKYWDLEDRIEDLENERDKNKLKNDLHIN